MTLETPRSSAPETPQNKLLTQFRATLDKRWGEFDIATLREAGGIELARNLHPDFQKAKKTFDEAKGVLSMITTDRELKNQMNAPGKLSATIADLETYFGTLNAQEKQKDYNKVVASTIADLTSLKAQMTGNFDDSRRAEQARAAANGPVGQSPASSNPLASLETSVPAVATMVTGLTGTVAGTGIVSESWIKTKVKGWVTDFEGWITNLLPDGPIKSKIAGFFSMLKVKLGITKPSETPGTLALTENEKVHGLRGAQKVFELLVKEKSIPESDKYLQEYFTHEKIQGKSIKQLTALIEEYKGDKGTLAKTLGFEEGQGDKVYAAIILLLSPKTRAKMKSVGIKDAEDIPVGRLFSSTAKYADMLDRVRSKGKNLDKKDLSFGDGFSDSVGEFIGEKKEMLQALKGRFEGFSPRVLKLLHTAYSTNKIDENQKFEANIKDLNPKEQEFLTKTLPEYTKKLPAFLQSLAFGSEKNTKVIDQYLKNPGLNYADAIDFFVLSGGHADLSQMNSFEKSQVILRMVVTLRSANLEDGYLYGAELAKAVLKDSREMTIPPDVKLILDDLKDILQEIVFIAGREAVALATGLFKSAPFFTSGVGLGAVGLLLLAFKLTPVGRVASTFMWLLTATGAISAFAAYKFTDDGKIIDAKTGEVKADIEEMNEKYKKKLS